MGFLWYVYSISWSFLCNFRGILLCFIKKKMCFNDNPKVFLCNFYWFLWGSCGIAMGFLWDGMSMIFL